MESIVILILAVLLCVTFFKLEKEKKTSTDLTYSKLDSEGDYKEVKVRVYGGKDLTEEQQLINLLLFNGEEQHGKFDTEEEEE